MPLSRLAVGVVLVCVMGASGAALAADPPSSSSDAQHGSTSSANVDGFGQAVSIGTLEHYSGGSSLVQSTNNLTGTVVGDSATNVTTGTNSIGGDSFAGASGLPSVVQNTGNNVLIQNAVIVNVQMKP
jgi:hypothetical protein